MRKITLFFLVLMGLATTSIAQDLFSEQIVITTDAEGAWSVFASDLDGDGYMDILSASAYESKIAWYKNEGNGNYGDQIIITTSASGARSVFAIDLDGDGDIDVLSASQGDDKIAWYENDGNGNFGEQNIITTDTDFAVSIHSCDIDGDGDMDVLSASSYDNKIAWYENDGNGNFGSQIIITTNATYAYSVFASDLDGDGDMDVLSASVLDDKLAWYENDGSGNFEEQITITTDADGANSIYTSDLDGDGDMDVLSASWNDNKIAWYENDGNGNFGEQLTITTDANGANSVYASDLDRDGDIDVLSASWSDDKIAWYENDGNGNFGEQLTITTDADIANSVYANDMDGDGDFDVLSASEQDGKIAWYRNNTYQFSQPTNQEGCPTSSVEFNIGNYENIDAFQWQLQNGSTYENLSDNDQYSGTTTQTLIINNITTDMNNNHYRCVLTINGNTVESNDAILTVLPVPETAEILGNPNPAPYETSTYSVPNNGSTYNWTVVGGNIISDNENVVDVSWGEEGYGSLTLIETATNGCSGIPVQLSIMIDVEEIAAKYNIHIFPNPTAGKLQIQGDNIQNIEILTLDGKLIHSITSKKDNIEIDLSKEAKGVYLIQFTLEDEVFSKKLILQ